MHIMTSRRPEHASVENSGMAIDVAEWLQKLGLEQYAFAFAQNDIDEGICVR